MDTISFLERFTPESLRKRRLGHAALRALWSIDIKGRGPSFLIIGAQKAGTTFLHNVVGNHPKLRRPATKEVAFYTYRFARGMRFYRSHFPKCGPGYMSFESTADYLFHPLVPQRIKDTLPDVKLIICLREPVSRAISHYGHSVANNFEEWSFRDAILREEERTAPEYEKLKADPNYEARSLMRFSYGAKGRYIEQIRRYADLFPREKMLILDSKEIFGETNSALVKVEKFLGIEEWTPAASIPPKNVGKAKQELDQEALEHLKEMYKGPNAELFDYLGWKAKW